MRAVVYSAPGDVTVAEVADPTPLADTDVIVQVSLSGICGTDLHAISGHLPGVVPGTVLGHEFVGTVVDAGRAVRLNRVGDVVMSSDFTACGCCWWCRRGDHWHCDRRQFFGTGTAFGPALSGAQADYVRVPFADTTLTRLPAGVSPAAALLIGDNLATGWAAAVRARVTPGDVVAVIGGGPVGQLASLTAQVHGAAAVVLSDPLPQRRALAAEQGALTAEPAGLRPVVDELTGRRGADVVIEAVGGSVGLTAALAAVRPGGFVASVSAHSQPSWDFPLADAFARELTVSFVIGDSIRSRDRLSALVAAGILDPTVVISDHRPLREAAAGYRDLSSQRSFKVVLEPMESR